MDKPSDRKPVVEVRGRNIAAPPLIASTDAASVVARASNGAPVVLLVRMGGSHWGVWSADDHDWEDMLKKYVPAG